MEAGDLAELLRSLKERSGLSYGALAKRLHVSTSTLHRYCNGSAVPTEFAPVERLARLCKATPQELMEVHRRWIVADATRGRKAPSPAPAQAPAQAEEQADGTPAASPPPEEPVEPHAPEAPEGPARPAGPDEPAEPEPTTPPRGRRPRKVLLAALSVVAAVTALGAAALGADLVRASPGAERPGHPVAAASSPRAKTSAPGKPGTGGEPSGTPSSPGARKSEDSEDGAAEKGGSEEGTGGGPTASAAPPADRPDSGAKAGTPLTAHVRPYAFEDPCSQRYLLDRAPRDVTPPPTEQDAPGWVSTLGGVAAGEQFIEITLQGTGKDTVVLEGLHVRVRGTKAPLAWNSYVMGVGCGGDVSTKSFGVDLDSARPVVAPAAGQRDFPYKVTESDPEVFYIKAGVKQHDVTWDLELQWSSGGRRGVLRLDDRGRPFRTSGAEGRPVYAQPLGSARGWEPLPPA
ncbi:helix-turn-helix domain-containing protein [Streptomyces sp. NPDC053079]|uniref:helix-turn-helix domain-containing protein n=1 Tax=Streptomyces sp. NPDC053079 TaxID=3365697 RepID=UPI0037D3FCDF